MTAYFKIKGRNGHRIKESFNPSHCFKDCKGVKYVVYNADITGSNEFVIFAVIAATCDAINDALSGQISDGLFENNRIGDVSVFRIET